MSNITNLKFKDGDDDYDTSINRISVCPVDNGFIITIDDDDHEWQEVYTSKSELLRRLDELI